MVQCYGKQSGSSSKTSQDPTILLLSTQRNGTQEFKHVCTPVFTVACFPIAKTRKQTKYPQMMNFKQNVA